MGKKRITISYVTDVKDKDLYDRKAVSALARAVIEKVDNGALRFGESVRAPGADNFYAKIEEDGDLPIAVVYWVYDKSEFKYDAKVCSLRFRGVKLRG